MSADNPSGFDARDAVELLNFHLIIAALLLFLAICGYTEFNAQKGSIGFPHRLFTLPLSSFELVALPMFLGVAAAELLGLVWRTLIFGANLNVWGTMLIGVYVVVYQAVLWTLPALGSLRMLIHGVVGMVFIIALGLPSFPQETLPWWLREGFLMVWLLVVALSAFFGCWSFVAQQRSGGGLRRDWIRSVVERASDVAPRRRKDFNSAAAAHFWFEWRRSGFMLPLLVGAMLVAVIGPLSLGDDGGGTVRILIAVLAMPMVLAFPVGKAFSKPDLWSSDMSVPSFVAVRPISTDDLVETKMKVAAVSAAVSWLLVCAFIALWFGLWASLDGLNMIRLLLWAVYGHSMYPQYALVILSLAAAMLMTWRFLVSSLWLGLSGNRALFATTAIPYSLAPIFVLAFAILIPGNEDSILSWMYRGFGSVLPTLVRIAAIAVTSKLWIAAWSWRDINRVRVRQYLFLWICGTLVLVAFALVSWAGLRYIVPSDSDQLRSLLVLCALLVIPFARLGLAPGSLARNRHRL